VSQPSLTAEQIAAASVVVPIDSIRPHPRNPNKGSVEVIRESLRIHGQYRTIVVQRSTGFVLAGNTTWRAAKEEGWTGAPAPPRPSPRTSTSSTTRSSTAGGRAPPTPGTAAGSRPPSGRSPGPPATTYTPR